MPHSGPRLTGAVEMLPMPPGLPAPVQAAAPAPSSAALMPFIDPDTEAQLLAGIVQRNSDLLRSGLLADLDASQFSTPAYQWFVDKVLSEKEEPPSWPILHEKIVANFQKEDQREQTIMILKRLYDLEIAWLDDAVASFRRFIAFQVASVATRTCFESFQRTRNVELSLRSLSTGVDNSMRILQGSQLQIVDYAENWKEREAQRKVRRDNPDLFPRLRMGIAAFDAQVKMEPCTVTNFLAPAKRHKSIILASLAYAAILQGFNVALVVVENTIDLTTSRLDAMFLQLNYDRVCSYLKTPAEKAYADTLFQRMHAWPQRLKIIKGTPQQTGTAEVERELLVAREKDGFRADVKIYDYMNIMKPSVKSVRDDWQAQTQIVWDLQGVAKKKGDESIVITASQTNVAGLATDKEGKPVKVQTQHQGRAIGITQGVDATIAIDMEPPKTGEFNEGALRPTIILSLLQLRDGAITTPEIRLVSEIDRMCIEREQRRLWNEVDDGGSNPIFPGDL